MRVVGVAWAIVVSSGACAGGDTGHGDASAPNRVEIVDSSGALGALADDVRMLLDATIDGVAAVLDLHGVTVTLDTDATRAIAGYGVGGFTPDGSHVRIDVDPSFPALADVIGERLPFVCAHELHHAKRFRGPGYGATLLEALVSEGLADHFAVVQLGAPPPPWTHAFPTASNEEYLEIARRELDSRDYDHARWFYGASDDLPNWTGYTLGFQLIAEYLAGHTSETAATLANAPAEWFRPT